VAYVERLSGTARIRFPACGVTACFRNAGKFTAFRFGLPSPRISPVVTSRAAKESAVPRRT
jgi:hypothetical protein